MKLTNNDIDIAMELEEQNIDAFYYNSIIAKCLYALKKERKLEYYDGSYSEAVNALEKHGFDLSERDGAI